MSKSGPPPEVYHPPYGGYPHEYSHHPHHHGGPPHYGHAPPPQSHVSNTFAPVTSQANNQNTNVVVNMGDSGGEKGRNYKRDWSTQLLGCMEDCGGCMCTCMFLPCMMCMMATRMGECFLLPYFVPQALMAMRVKVREANRIKGSIFMDCVATTCCPMLSLCQIKREMDNIDARKPGTEL